VRNGNVLQCSIKEQDIFLEVRVMKKLLVMVLILSIPVLANAGLVITVNGVIDPPDSTIAINPSDHIVLGVADNGGVVGQSTLALGVSSLSAGPGSLDASKIALPFGGTAVLSADADTAAAFGIQSPFISLEIGGGLQGTVVDNVIFHCDGPGDVTIALVDNDGNVLDTQVIHQPVPEPVTMALLGLGGLLLRRRTA
jgi:hypothetical protein